MAGRDGRDQVAFQWPAGLRDAVRDRVGQRGMTQFVIDAVLARLAQEAPPEIEPFVVAPPQKPKPKPKPPTLQVQSNRGGLGARPKSPDRQMKPCSHGILLCRRCNR